jgi:hypothetical protein
LDVSKNKELELISCEGNGMEELNITGATSLAYLWCHDNNFKTLAIQDTPRLKQLYCRNNQLTELDLSKHVDMDWLFCYGNKLTELDVSACVNMRRFYCNDNLLASLDVTKNTVLEQLHCHNNLLTALDVTKNEKLGILYCYGNKMASLGAVAGWADRGFSVNTPENPDSGTFRFYPQDTEIVGGVAPKITTTSLPGGTVGEQYSQALAATGDAPITWNLVGGALPNDLMLTTGGVILGEPSAHGDFTFTVRAANDAGVDNKELSIAIKAKPEEPEPQEGDESLKSAVASARMSVLKAFTAESAAPFEAALATAEAALADSAASQGDVDAALAALRASALKLVVKPEYELYKELIDLLISIVALDGPLYTAASWNALMDVAEGAWALVDASEYVIIKRGIEAKSGGDGGISLLADIPDAIIFATMKLREALLSLQFKGPGGTGGPGGPFVGKPMDAKAVAKDAPLCELAPEKLGDKGYGARFTVNATEFENVTMIYMSVCYNYENFDAEIALSDFLEANGCELVIRREAIDKPSAKLATVYLMIQHKTFGGEIAASTNANKEAELLSVVLKPKAGFTQGAATVMLSQIDIAYDDPVNGISDAELDIVESVASTWVRMYSLYDVNRDGRITLADVDLVRRNMGKGLLTHPAEWAANEPLRRCDLNGDDKVDINDLLIIMVKYEETLN